MIHYRMLHLRLDNPPLCFSYQICTHGYLRLLDQTILRQDHTVFTPFHFTSSGNSMNITLTNSLKKTLFILSPKAVGVGILEEHRKDGSGVLQLCDCIRCVNTWRIVQEKV